MMNTANDPTPSPKSKPSWALSVLFRTHLGARLMAMFIAVALLPMTLVVILSYQQARASLVNLALSKVEQEADLTAKDMETYLGQFFSDVLALSKVPEVQGIIRAEDHQGTDPVTHETYASWIDRLNQIFASTVGSKGFYRQLVYLDENGDEIVRVDYQDEMITVASDDARLGVGQPLQNGVSASYFTEAQKLQSREVYISPVILAPQTGQAGSPPVPILYLSTPIYDEAKKFRGVVMCGVYASSFLDRLKVDHGHIYLTNPEGFYLAHPDPARTFTSANVASDFPDAYAILRDSKVEVNVALDAGRREVVAMRKFHFDARHPELYWLLVRTLPEAEVLGEVQTLGLLTFTVALLSTLAVALLAYRLARGFTRPILELTDIAEQISETNLPQLVVSMGQVAEGNPAIRLDLGAQPVAVKTKDEVGQLGAAFNRMIDSLREAELRLLATQEQLRLQKDAAEEARRSAEAANQAKSIFLANMSHELRTPLNAILGYAQILKRRSGHASDLTEGLEIIHRSGEHLLTLINDVLDLAKIEAGKLELNPAPVHLPTFLRQVIEIIRARAEAKNLSLTYKTLSPLPEYVLAEETRLRQVLLNLLGNAVKFTDQGQVTFRVLESSESRSGTRDSSHRLIPDPRFANSDVPFSILHFEVEDTGVGISPDQLERLFQPFEQVGETSRKAEGTGLGLAISRQLVYLMGGDLQVKSTLGQGSTFWFEIALPLVKVAAEAAPSPSRTITGYKGPRRKILIVDDIPSNRAVLTDLLQPLGFDLAEAADGQQALETAQAMHSDLILMDRWMPVMNGFAAVQQMRKIPELERVPVIAVSASVSEEDQAQSQEAGYDGFLSKPIHWPRLARLLEEHLELEWKYEERAETTGRQRDEKAILVPPPQEELEILLDLALLGDVSSILEHTAHLETLGEPYLAFARRLRALAQGFDEREILALIKQYLEMDT